LPPVYLLGPKQFGELVENVRAIHVVSSLLSYRGKAACESEEFHGSLSHAAKKVNK